MTTFTDLHDNTKTTWIDYFCNNPEQGDEKAKNKAFLSGFLSDAQRRRVQGILGINIQRVDDYDDYDDYRYTQYRQIAKVLLTMMPGLQFSVPGWSSFPDACKPLLVIGRAQKDGSIKSDERLRLHYLNGAFFLIAVQNILERMVHGVLSNNQRNELSIKQNTNPLRIYRDNGAKWKENNWEKSLGFFMGTVTLDNNNPTTDNGGMPGIDSIRTDLLSNDAIRAITNMAATAYANHNDEFVTSRTNKPYYPKLNDDEVEASIENQTSEKETMIALNTIFYGPPGTGKTYTLTDRALDIIGIEGADEMNENESFSKCLRQGRIEFTTFHQNYAYEDFIEGLRAEYKVGKNTDQGSVVYEVVPGILKRISYRALYAWLTGETPGFEITKNLKDVVLNYLRTGKIPDTNAQENEIPNFVLIIDEINRGNVARIFGELITLVEDSKRARRPNELGEGLQPLLATLPYTKEPFILPPNLYIIGTMNTADRSLIGLDAALRRRFVFEEMPPQPELLPDDVGGINLRNFLTKLNQRIQDQDTPDHCIGHAYFMGVQDIHQLAGVMRNKVIPQLQEYFHDRPQDLETLLSVGGDSFVDSRGQINAEKLKTPSLYNAF